jgi:uncharacterized protein YggU (UPF0235/DUF167 family)
VPLRLNQKGNWVWIPVRVTPGSSQDEIKGVRHGVLQVRVRAAPTHGQANEATRTLLAKALGVRPAALKLQQGATARHKQWAVEGLSLSEVEESLKHYPELS